LSALSFIIPVRHPANASNWAAVVGRLEQTIESISQQTSGDWNGFIVMNREASFPQVKAPWQIVHVDFPPNLHYDLAQHGKQRSYDAVRLDKGKRLCAGIIAATGSEYVMPCDDDDFLSVNIADFVSKHKGPAGWDITKGYSWGEGSSYLVGENQFSSRCGTSHIIRRDLLQLGSNVEDTDVDYIKKMFGSHLLIARLLGKEGHPFEILPFRGAVYRMGHADAHSRSKMPMRARLFSLKAFARPDQWIETAFSTRRLSPALAAEFGMHAALRTDHQHL
jgi:hypothetical protein